MNTSKEIPADDSMQKALLSAETIEGPGMLILNLSILLLYYSVHMYL